MATSKGHENETETLIQKSKDKDANDVNEKQYSKLNMKKVLNLVTDTVKLTPKIAQDATNTVQDTVAVAPTIVQNVTNNLKPNRRAEESDSVLIKSYSGPTESASWIVHMKKRSVSVTYSVWKIILEKHLLPATSQLRKTGDEKKDKKVKYREKRFIRVLKHTHMGEDIMEKKAKNMVTIITSPQKTPPENENEPSTDYFCPDGWKVKGLYPNFQWQIKQVKGSEVKVEVYGTMRYLHFDNEESAADFSSQLRTIQNNFTERATRYVEDMACTLGYSKVSDLADKNLTFLVDIVGAQDLNDSQRVDSFVEVRFDGVAIHSTDVVPKTTNPIFTIQDKSLFLFSRTGRQLFGNYINLTFVVFDKNFGSKIRLLGAAKIDGLDLYHGNGDRLVVPLRKHPDEGKLKGYDEGKLALRVRRATEADIEFMQNLKDDLEQDKTGRYLPRPEYYKDHKTRSALFDKKLRKSNKNHETEYKVRPHPDPEHPSELYLTSSAVAKKTLEPSRKWYNVGSGSLMRIHLEILGCNNLPNKDVGSIVGNYTDAFVQIVYEDVIVRTSVIDDSLSPKFLPWADRAFILNARHPSSQILLGVCDYDNKGAHDLLGRVSIDLTNLRADTLYTLTYNLYKSAFFADDRVTNNGTITIRLRKEIFDPRQELIRCLAPVPRVFVNTNKKYVFDVIHKTVEGKKDTEEYDLDIINSHVNDLTSHLECLNYIFEGLKHLVLWRGHYPATIRIPDMLSSSDTTLPLIDRFSKKVNVKLPIHSMIAFIVFTSVIEHPNLIPSFCCFLLGWLLLAMMEWRSRNPNPWKHTYTFLEYLNIFIYGEIPQLNLKRQINKHENKEAIDKYDGEWKTYIANIKKKQEEDQKVYLKEQEELREEMQEAQDADDITTIRKNYIVSPMALLRPYLYPVQQYLNTTCKCVRIGKNVLLWNEPIYSFLLALLSFLLSILFAFIPWHFLIIWTLRIVCWTLFGPWMKLADIYYFSKFDSMSEEEIIASNKESRKKRNEKFEDILDGIREKRERMVKLKYAREYMFGKFITSVPILKLDRFKDEPLSESYAVPYDVKDLTMAERAFQNAASTSSRIHGQKLVDDLVFRLDDKVTDLKVKDTKSAESQTMTILRMSSVVILGGVMTWISVPIMIDTVQFSSSSLRQFLF